MSLDLRDEHYILVCNVFMFGMKRLFSILQPREMHLQHRQLFCAHVVRVAILTKWRTYILLARLAEFFKTWMCYKTRTFRTAIHQNHSVWVGYGPSYLRKKWDFAKSRDPVAVLPLRHLRQCLTNFWVNKLLLGCFLYFIHDNAVSFDAYHAT